MQPTLANLLVVLTLAVLSLGRLSSATATVFTPVHRFQQSNVRSTDQSGEKSQFVDTLLMGILQMLLGGGAGGMGVPEAGQTPAVELAPGEEEYAAPETGGTPAPVLPGAPTNMEAFKGMSPESIIATALNAQQNQMGALSNQVALLEKEIKAWQAMKAKALEGGQNIQGAGTENAIQLTIKYPGTAANETNAEATAEEKLKQDEAAEEQEKEEMLDLAGAKKSGKVDPTKLNVPLIVVAPKMENDFHQILLKTIKQATVKGEPSALAAQMQEAIKVSPEERIKISERLMKEANSNAAFFQKDKEVTQNRVNILKSVTPAKF